MRPRASLGSLPAAVLILCGCAHSPAVPEPDLTAAAALPPVAAQYVTTARADDSEHRVQWRMWREPDRIVTENLAAHTGEVWQRDGASVFHQKVFHEDRRSVEFQMDDLRITDAAPSWPRQQLLIDPQLLRKLKPLRSGWRDGYPYRRYVGESDGASWDITLRMDVMLPVTIVRKHDGVLARTQLEQAHPLPAAPWSPTPRDDYEVIDFADLGDRQADPFVMKVQDQLGRPHAH